jgi:hypothetical protein
MRPTLILASVLSFSVSASGFAQIKADPGVIGPRAVPRTPDQSPNAAANSSVPAGQARQEHSGSGLPAIPADEARATMQGKCGGPVSGVGVDSHATWHATCHKDGRTLAMTLGTDGNVEMH